MPLVVVVFVLVSTAPNFNPLVQCVFVLVDEIVILPLASLLTVVEPAPSIWCWLLKILLSNILKYGFCTSPFVCVSIAPI